MRASKPKLPPAGVVAAVNRIRTKVSRLHTKMVPPPVALLERITGMWEAQAVYVMAELGIADAIAAGAVDSAAIAKRVKANTGAVYRLLRACSVSGLVTENERDRFALTPVGECLRVDHPMSMRDMARIQGGYNWAHWAELLHAVRTGENTVRKVRGKEFFAFLAESPADAAAFDGAMTNISSMETQSVLAAYDFSSYKVIADVGGGHGAFLASVLAAYPALQGILFDRPEVVQGAAALLRAKGVEARCRVEAGSFFEKAPQGADVIVMKHIIHDWSDEESLTILRHCRARLPERGKLLLVEAVIPGPNDRHFSKYLDLEMLVVTTGKERTEAEYAELFGKAGFRLDRIVRTVSIASVIEASPV